MYVLLQPGDHWQVVVDDSVHHRVEHGARAQSQHLRVRLHAPAHVAERAGRPVADGDQKFGAGEDQDLAEFNVLLFVDVAGRLQHHEQGVVVDL